MCCVLMQSVEPGESGAAWQCAENSACFSVGSHKTSSSGPRKQSAWRPRKYHCIGFFHQCIGRVARWHFEMPNQPNLEAWRNLAVVWLGGVVVSALGMRTRRPRFESRVVPLFHWVATLGKLFTHIASPVSQLQETGVQKGIFGA